MSNTPICDTDTPDPWIIQHDNLFYLTFTQGDRVSIWSSPTLTSFQAAQKSTVFHPRAEDPWSADLWAPELHLLNGRWYIYFCGAPRSQGNPGHRTLILRSRASDPMDAAAWEFLGPLRGLPGDQWSIDATVFTVPSAGGSDMYVCYSGWPLGDHSDTQQDLFVAKLRSPEEAVAESVTCISRASLGWERPDGGRRGVNEGPTFLALPPSRNLPRGFEGIVYSAHGSWGPEYKLGILALVDAGNPCHERAWFKREAPLLVSDEKMGPPFGPGHASFVLGDARSGDDGVYCVYHGTEGMGDGWANRKARVLRLDSGVFSAGAGTVCCGKRAWEGYPGGGGPGASQQNASAPGTGGAAGAMPVGHMSGKGQKVWGEVEKMVPGQYRGYLDKAKKFFQ